MNTKTTGKSVLDKDGPLIAKGRVTDGAHGIQRLSDNEAVHSPVFQKRSTVAVNSSTTGVTGPTTLGLIPVD
jgi:hypothetical protein